MRFNAKVDSQTFVAQFLFLNFEDKTQKKA